MKPSCRARARRVGSSTASDPESVGAIDDPGEHGSWRRHEQYRLGLETLGPYLAHVHAKNSAWRQTGKRADGNLAWQAEWAPLDEGIVDLRDLFTTLRAVEYDGWISVEDFTTEPPLGAGAGN